MGNTRATGGYPCPSGTGSQLLVQATSRDALIWTRNPLTEVSGEEKTGPRAAVHAFVLTIGKDGGSHLSSLKAGVGEA